MSRNALKARTDVCHLCEFLLPRQLPVRQRYRTPSTFHPSRTFTTARRRQAPVLATPARSKPGTGLGGSINRGQSLPPNVTEEQWELFATDVKDACENLLSTERVPSEQEVLSVLERCKELAEFLVLDHPESQKRAGAASALLSLDGSTKKATSSIPSATFQRAISKLSELAYSVVKHSFIFITPRVLTIYTEIQSTLKQPQTFPEVFHLYANKPIPTGGTPFKFSQQNPNKISNAIPVPVADSALQTAIDSKQLNAAMDIVESSYTTKAFHRAKFFRKGLLPATAAAVAPVAAYTIATQLATLQTTMDSEMATNVAFAGIMAYTLFTGTIGVVAITTANDQMDRVTWAQGLPLRERWMREEERAAIDKIAGSWGFRETWRRGEEEGEEWDALREWIGMKGMILDRVELMEGME